MLEEHDGAKRLAPRPGFPRRGIPDVGLRYDEVTVAPLFSYICAKKEATGALAPKEICPQSN